jgi:hypothetical protein
VELLVARCAGLDVAKDEVVACMRVPDGHGGRGQEVRRFQTFTSGLEALAGWLAGEGVTRVVLEATGQQLEAGVVGAGGAGLPVAVGQRPPRPGSCLAARPMSGMPPGWRSCWSMGCCGAAWCPPCAACPLDGSAPGAAGGLDRRARHPDRPGARSVRPGSGPARRPSPGWQAGRRDNHCRHSAPT